MSKEPKNAHGLLDPQRRHILRAASGAAIGGIAATALAITSPALAQNAGSGNRDNGPLGGRLQGVQHSASPLKLWSEPSNSTPKCLAAAK